MERVKAESIDDYISGFPPDVQAKLTLLRQSIKEIVPNAQEKISYGMPTFFLKKNLIHFAAFKNHIGVYAVPETNHAFRDELEKYKTGKGSIQFPLEDDLPIELIKNLVRFRLTTLKK